MIFCCIFFYNVLLMKLYNYLCFFGKENLSKKYIVEEEKRKRKLDVCFLIFKSIGLLF